MISLRTRERLQYLKASGYSKAAAATELQISSNAVAKYWDESRELLKVDADPDLQALDLALNSSKPDYGLIRRIVAHFAMKYLYNPRKIKPVLDRYYRLAVEGKINITQDYVNFLRGEQKGNSGVVVNVSTSIKVDPSKTYDITGEVIEVTPGD